MLALCPLAQAGAGAQPPSVLSGGCRLDFAHGALEFDAAGELTAYETPLGRLELAGIIADAGVDGGFLLNTLGHQRFFDMNTWDLARIVPRAGAPCLPEEQTLSAFDDRVEAVSLTEGMEFKRVYTPTALGLRVDLTLTSRRSYVTEIQGIALNLRALPAGEQASFRFPGNTPYAPARLGALRHFAAVQADYCAPLTRVEGLACGGLNLLFLNEQEKWSTALWRDREFNLHAAFLAMTEGLLHAGEQFEAGPLYLQLTGESADAYAPVRRLYAQAGWQAPQDGYHPTGPLYSAHPHGTMDSGFRDRCTMAEFAATLPGLHEMGIESVWILPIFEHTGRGVYEPADQALIDPRYGTDADVRAFCDAAHGLGMKVLFDYVPHGPYPADPLALAHPEWCSVHRSGRQHIEWDCVSFDMANPDYQAYTRQLVLDHVARFGVDGGRIDCAMGGLSNWQPAAGNRPSHSGIRGGLQIVSAIRQGFLDAGRQPLLLPENFHPLPWYAPVSDIFYDMPLYRAMHQMRGEQLDEAAFAGRLAFWLHDEQASGVPGLRRLRFLGNHDTVSWTWDRQRASAVYGVEKAKALWTLFAFIDGVPFLYQGDEYAPIYDKRSGLDLRDFFRDLYAAREHCLSPEMDITYHLNDSAVIAFTRSDGSRSRLALVNLGADPAEWPLPKGHGDILYGTGRPEEGLITLGPYQSLLIDLP